MIHGRSSKHSSLHWTLARAWTLWQHNTGDSVTICTEPCREFMSVLCLSVIKYMKTEVKTGSSQWVRGVGIKKFSFKNCWIVILKWFSSFLVKFLFVALSWYVFLRMRQCLQTPWSAQDRERFRELSARWRLFHKKRSLLNYYTYRSKYVILKVDCWWSFFSDRLWMLNCEKKPCVPISGQEYVNMQPAAVMKVQRGKSTTFYCSVYLGNLKAAAISTPVCELLLQLADGVQK